jgi:hypothetical protein
MMRAHLALTALTALVAGAAPAAAADLLFLQQTVLPEETAPVMLVVDRERVAMALLRQAARNRFVVEVTLVGQPNLTLSVTCQDVAGGRQVVDALRPRGITTLDLSGRCWF